MEYEEDIKKLEANIERMLRGLEASQGERKRLKAEIVRLEDDNRILKEQISRLSDEKKHVRQRVSGLLNVIEKWEETAGGADNTPKPASNQGKAPSEPVQGMLIAN